MHHLHFLLFFFFLLLIWFISKQKKKYCTKKVEKVTSQIDFKYFWSPQYNGCFLSRCCIKGCSTKYRKHGIGRCCYTRYRSRGRDDKCATQSCHVGSKLTSKLTSIQLLFAWISKYIISYFIFFFFFKYYLDRYDQVIDSSIRQHDSILGDMIANVQNPDIKMALFLLFERSKGKDSFWHPYLQVMRFLFSFFFFLFVFYLFQSEWKLWGRKSRKILYWPEIWVVFVSNCLDSSEIYSCVFFLHRSRASSASSEITE